LIDDDDMFRYVMRQILSNAPEYRLLEAKDGEEGLRMARAETPDVVILDLQMPEMDGFAAFEALTAEPQTQRIPIVVLTSLTVDAGLNARFPPGTQLLSKNMISRESVSLLLREAMQAAQ
jgi:CheY-like chemotaxis protein